MITDSSLRLPMLYSYPASDLIRGQQLTLYLEVPVGKKVYFDESVYADNLPNQCNYRFLKRYAGQSCVVTKRGLSVVE